MWCVVTQSVNNWGKWDGSSVIRGFIYTYPCCWKHLTRNTCQYCQSTAVKRETLTDCLFVVNVLSIPLLFLAWLSIRICHLFILFESWNKTVWCHFYSLTFLQNFQQFCGKIESALLTTFTLDLWIGVEFTQEILSQRVGTYFWESLTSVLF